MNNAMRCDVEAEAEVDVEVKVEVAAAKEEKKLNARSRDLQSIFSYLDNLYPPPPPPNIGVKAPFSPALRQQTNKHEHTESGMGWSRNCTVCRKKKKKRKDESRAFACLFVCLL